MSDSLKDQLLQAGLVTKEQAAKAERPQRRPRKPRQRNEPSSKAPRDSSVMEGLQALIRNHRVSVPVRGQQRWYFETRDGRLPYLAISPQCGKLLERGEAAIVEPEVGVYRVVSQAGAEKIQALDGSCVRFWNSPGSST